MKTPWKVLVFFCILALAGLYGLDTSRAKANLSDTPFIVEVSDPVVPNISVPVYTLKPTEKRPFERRENPLYWLDTIPPTDSPPIPDALTPGLNEGTTPDPLLTFEGLGSDGIAPPDPVGDVGPHHYVQMVNVSFQIWDKGDPDNGIPPTILQADTPFNALFTGSDGQCEDRNDGDPIVVYDDLADRWVLSQFVLGSPLALCVAVSTTPDPTGTYHLYEFPMPAYPDYPKMGAWADAYYLGTNSGLANDFYAHAFEREKMLAGLPAARQSVGGLPNFVMPADLDGQIPPAEGNPGIFYTMLDEEYANHPEGVDRLAVYEFDVDWEAPENTSLILVQELPIANFNYTVCGYFIQECIPQPYPNQKLDSLSYWPMFRFQYRSFGSFASLVGNFTVDVNGEDRAAIRWFELRKTGGTYSLYQEGTYAPDTDHRWIGSVAMDVSGNLALGYNVSSEVTIPSLRYASRLVSDPPGTLGVEAILITGTGVQTGTVRWGDYSNMVVDPVDGCHFWFTGPYHDEHDSGFNWNTRIGVFKLPTCGGNTGTLTGQVTDGVTGLAEVAIQARASVTQTGSTTTAENGSYAVSLSEGMYVVTATAYGYLPGIAAGVEIVSGTTTLQNFALSPAPVHLITGTVSDGAAGWPLYAEIQISGYPESPIWTDPATGSYQITLPEGNYTFEVHAWQEGYLPQVVDLTVASPVNLNFEMAVDAVTCKAPGYVFNGIVEPFDSETLPEGWVTVDNINLSNPQVWMFDDPGGRGNLTGGTGAFAIIDSDYFGAEGSQDTSLITPPLDFTELSSVHVAFDTDFKVWDQNPTNEMADVAVSTDGGESWINVWHREMTGGNYNGHVDVDISGVAAHQAEVLIQFRYSNASNDWWWQVDNVAYGALTCDPLPGGLVVGNVYDANFDTPLNEVPVSIPEVISTTTAPTPEDTALDDGYYFFFVPAGTYTLTVAFPDYGSQTHPLLIEPGTTLRQDAQLPAGWLDLQPDSLTLALGFGYSATLPVELTNLGGISATFALSDTAGRSDDLPWLTGSPLTGTLPTNSTRSVELVFSTMSITETGVLTGNLHIFNNTPYGALTLPVTLTVGPPAPSVVSDPDQTGVGMPGTTFRYTVVITNTGNVPDWFDITLTEGKWDATTTITSLFLNPGAKASFEVYVAIPPTAGYLEGDAITLSITGAQSGATSTTQMTTIAQYPYLHFLPVIIRKL